MPARGLSQVTINQTIKMLGDFFEFLREAGELQMQPVRKHRHSVLAPTSLPKPMAEADLPAFFQVIDAVRDRLIFLLMLRCGLRISEAAHLKASDIDWEQQALLVEQVEGRKDRWVYLSADAVESLRECRH